MTGLLNLKAQSDAVLEAAREKEERGAQAKAVPGSARTS